MVESRGRSRVRCTKRVGKFLMGFGIVGTIAILGLLALASSSVSNDRISQVRAGLSNAQAQNVMGARRRLLAEASFTIDADPGGYGQRLGYIALPGLALCILSFWFGLFFGCFRCCGLCGGGAPSKVYTSGERLWPLILAVIVAVAILVGFIVGLVGSGEVGNGAKGFLGGIVQKAIETKDFTDSLTQTLLGTTASPTDIANIQKSAQSLVDSTKDTESFYTDSIEPIRSAITVVCLIFPLLGAIFLLLTKVAKVGALASVSMVLFFVSLFLCWLMFSVHVLLAEVITDICNDVQTLLSPNDRLTVDGDGNESTILKLAECPDDVGSLQIDAIDGAIVQMIAIDFRNYNALILRSPPGDVWKAEADATVAKLSTLRDATTSGITSAAAQRAIDLIDVALTIDSFVTRPGAQTCPYVRDIFAVLEPDLCGPLKNGLTKVAAGTGLCGAIILLFGVLAAVKGKKRFPNQDPNKVAPGGDPNQQGQQMQPLVAVTPGQPGSAQQQPGKGGAGPSQKQNNGGPAQGVPVAAPVEAAKGENDAPPTPGANDDGGPKHDDAPPPLIQDVDKKDEKKDGKSPVTDPDEKKDGKSSPAPVTDPDEKPADKSDDNNDKAVAGAAAGGAAAAGAGAAVAATAGSGDSKDTDKASKENEERMRTRLAQLDNEKRMRANLASLENEDKMKTRLAQLDNEERMRKNLASLQSEDKMRESLKRLEAEGDGKDGGEEKKKATPPPPPPKSGAPAPIAPLAAPPPPPKA